MAFAAKMNFPITQSGLFGPAYMNLSAGEPQR
jgi:hypothetical protein